MAKKKVTISRKPGPDGSVKLDEASSQPAGNPTIIEQAEAPAPEAVELEQLRRENEVLRSSIRLWEALEAELREAKRVAIESHNEQANQLARMRAQSVDDALHAEDMRKALGVIEQLADRI